MEKEERKNYETAGKIWKSAAQKAEKLLKPDASLLKIAEEIESFIADEIKEEKVEGGLAFPVNLSLNNIAAHATPSIEDPSVLNEKDLLKVDIGVQVEGFIADGAFSFNASNDFAKQIEANETALEEALKQLKIGQPISVIGNTVQPIAEKAGFKVIENLTGHGLGLFTQHAPPSVPNVRNHLQQPIADELVIAIEPFFSTGRGFVADGSQIEIFSVEELKPVRDVHARKILDVIAEHVETLPFAERQLAGWITLSEFQRKVGLRELVRNKILHAYPILQEQKGAVVSQAERTVIVDGEEIIVINQ